MKLICNWNQINRKCHIKLKNWKKNEVYEIRNEIKTKFNWFSFLFQTMEKNTNKVDKSNDGMRTMKELLEKGEGFQFIRTSIWTSLALVSPAIRYGIIPANVIKARAWLRSSCRESRQMQPPVVTHTLEKS